jgi:LmbE family N-acetylglucosaminyl deacetylase
MRPLSRDAPAKWAARNRPGGWGSPLPRASSGVPSREFRGVDMRFARALVLAAHTDDAELGCGAAMARMLEEGVEVFVAAFSTAQDSVPPGWPLNILQQEFTKAMALLGIPPTHITVFDYPVRRLSYYRQEVLDNLIQLRRDTQPDLVLLPSGSDVHQDHQVLHMEGTRAFKDLSTLGYELPWNHIDFAAQAFVVVERHHLDRKWQALQAYESQFELRRPYFSREFIDGLARVRGLQVKTGFAEAFEVVRMRL